MTARTLRTTTGNNDNVVRTCGAALAVCALLQSALAHAESPSTPRTPEPAATAGASVAVAPASTAAASAPAANAPAPAPAVPASAAAAPSPPATASNPNVDAEPPAAAPTATANPATPPPPPAAATTDDAPAAERVWLHFGVNYPNAKLETRSVVDDDADWTQGCSAPCKQYVEIGGREVRVTAPDMTPSNAFRLHSGRGRVQFRVSGGSETVKTLGLGGLLGGIPVAMAGMAMSGYGIVSDKDALRDVGFVTLGVGAVAIAVAIPLLLSSTTRVYNEKGSRIAALEPFRF